MYSNSNTGKNPFDLCDDVDDETFVNYRSHNYDIAEARLYEEKRQQILEERRKIEDRMLQSSNLALRTLYETEEVGIGAADELVRQGEQLKNAERSLEHINSTMKTTQKHLTAMKSMFSGFKSYFGRTNSSEAPAAVKAVASSSDAAKPSGRLSQALDQVRGQADTARLNNHPSLRNRYLDTSGFGAALDDDYDEDSAVPKSQRGSTNPPLTRSQMVEQKVESDLTELNDGVKRLKMLAQGLSSELDDQLDRLNNLNNLADQAEGTIKFQTGQMNRLLKR